MDYAFLLSEMQPAEMASEETNEMTSEMTTANPWQVDSVQAFVCLKCPECTFDTKKGEHFRDHALENHPLSFVLFGKTLKEEGDFNQTKSADQLSSVLDFHLDTIGIKQELSEGNTEKPSVYKNSHKCSICKATFPQRYLLKNHINQVHFDINELPEGNDEKSSVGNNAHMCSICNQICPNQYTLKNHINQVHLDIRPYACTECDLKFKVRNHLKRHFNRKHSEVDPGLNPGNVKKDKEYVDSTVKQEYNDDSYYEYGDYTDQNVAAYCEPSLEEWKNYEYIDGSAGNDLAQKPKKKKPKVPGRKIDPEIRKKYTKIVHEGNKLFECNECKKTYVKPNSVRIHISSVHEGNRPMCTMCAKTFCHKNALQKHMTEVHEKKIVARCDKCDKAFRQKSALKEHVSRVHEGNKFICSFCGLELTSKTGLRQHMETIHEGKRPHLCTVCGADFSQQQHLKRHIESVHEKKQHDCTMCDKSFFDKSYLKKHIKLKHIGITLEERKPHLCIECGLRFTLRSNLRKHQRTVHEKSSACSCDRCGSNFASKENLNAHIKAVHEGIKPKSRERKPNNKHLNNYSVDPVTGNPSAILRLDRHLNAPHLKLN